MQDAQSKMIKEDEHPDDDDTNIDSWNSRRIDPEPCHHDLDKSKPRSYVKWGSVHL